MQIDGCHGNQRVVDIHPTPGGDIADENLGMAESEVTRLRKEIDVVINSAAVVSYLNGLNYLTSKDFYNELIEGSPSHSVTFSFNNAPDIVLSGYFQNGSFILQSSENENELFNDSSVNNKVFKSMDEFL